jgi:hypothetical protein
MLIAQHLVARHFRDWKDGKGANALGAVDKYTLNVRCSGRRLFP